MIKTIQEWIRRITDYPQIVDTCADLLQGNKAHLDQIELLKSQIKQLEMKKHEEVNNADYWNEKWQKNTIKYSAPKRKKVTEYLAYRPIEGITITANLLIALHNLHNVSVDKIPLVVMKWVEKEFKAGVFKYKLDKGEIWEKPEDVLRTKVNDCDGYGIVEYYLIREIFKMLKVWEFVKHRLKCVDGHVYNVGTINVYAGRHFYLMWLHSDGEFYTVESTFYRPRTKSQKLNLQYGTINYTFNEQFSWAQKSVSISKGDYNV